jgi:hypothetical protein
MVSDRPNYINPEIKGVQSICENRGLQVDILAIQSSQ